MNDPVNSTEVIGEPESPQSPVGPDAAPPAELPAVEPPTAGFIVQLFFVPALLVALFVLGYVLVYLPFGRIANSDRVPELFLKDFQGGNEERRWVAARELAMSLPRNAKWHRDGEFAAKLAEQLEKELGRANPSEREVEFQQYLASALGEFNSPAGVPALRRAINTTVPHDVRWAAAVSLGQLGVRSRKNEDAATAEALVAAVPDLVAASHDDNVAIRRLVAFALGGIGNTESVHALGPMLNDADREVTFNAASSLARAGSLAGQAVLLEMLDIDNLRTLHLPAEQLDALLESVPLSAIESLSNYLRRTPNANLDAFRPEIEHASAKGNIKVQTAARDLLIFMAKGHAQN